MHDKTALHGVRLWDLHEIPLSIDMVLARRGCLLSIWEWLWLSWVVRRQ
jgi:hypothetical protein